MKADHEVLTFEFAAVPFRLFKVGPRGNRTPDLIFPKDETFEFLEANALTARHLLLRGGGQSVNVSVRNNIMIMENPLNAAQWRFDLYHIKTTWTRLPRRPHSPDSREPPIVTGLSRNSNPSVFIAPGGNR